MAVGTGALGQFALGQAGGTIANDLTIGSPDLGTPSASVYYPLTASNLTTGSPSLDTPSAAVNYHLTANDFATGSPVLDTPAAAVFHALTASDLTTGSPTLDSPSAAVFYALTASGLTTGSPVLDTPAASVFYVLTATDFATGSPVLGTANIVLGGQFIAVDLETGDPVLDSPTATVFYALTAVNLATGAPVLDTPTLHPSVQLVANDFAPGSPVLATPSASVFHSLTAADLATGSPVFGAPVLLKILAATNLTTGSPDLGTPAAAVVYIASGVTPGAPVLDTPTLTVHYEVVPVDLDTGSPELGTPTYHDTFSFEVEDLETGVPELGQPALSFEPVPRAENLIDLDATLLDPIYASLIGTPARLFPISGAPVDVMAINHTNGVEVFTDLLSVGTVRPAIDVRLSELALHDLVREDLIGGQVALYPDTPEQEIWDIENIANRPGIWGEGSGELRLLLMDPVTEPAVMPASDFDILLDPIYASFIAHPARIYPGSGDLSQVDLLCINHTEGVAVFDKTLGVNTLRPHVDVRVKELATYGVGRRDLNGGQVLLWPGTARQQLWNIEDVGVRPGMFGERFGELRIFLMDRQA